MKKATIKSGNRQQANNKPNERTVKAKEGKTGEAKTPEDDRWRCPQCGSTNDAQPGWVKKTRISLFVIDNHGVKHPCYWQDGWVISADTSTDEWAFFARITPPKPGQVIGYRSGRFSPTPSIVADYIMCRVDTKGRRWQVEDICAVVDSMFGHFLEHCARAREAVAARPDRHPLDVVIGDPGLCGLWAQFALEGQKLLDAFVEQVRNGLPEDKKIDSAG